jgi:cobalt-zinc-cadmium efflux system membrane fusion protein
VTPGRTLDGWVEVSGIEAGAEVVTHGAFLLKSDVLRSKMGAGCAD